jgi:peptide chain release factor subunit 1
MKPDLNNVLRELSEVYDEQSMNTYVSVYVNKQGDSAFLEKRIHACQSLLNRDEQDNFLASMETIQDFIKQNTGMNLALFASHTHNFFRSVPLSVDIYDALIVDSSPYIRPIARILDEWNPFTLVLLNSHQAKIFSIDLGKAEQEKHLSMNIMNKHKKGGWSQARFQRLRKGAIHTFYAQVREYLEKRADEQIILAGPGPSKVNFKDMLPPHLQQRVVDIIDVDIDDEHTLFKESFDRMHEQEESQSHQAVQQLKQEILKDGLAVYGLEDTLQAVKRGQVDILLIEKDYKVKGCLCEHCQILKAGPIKDCPVCGGPVTEADVLEEIIEFAERTDAKLEFTNDEELSKLGHIGGILRYKD